MANENDHLRQARTNRDVARYLLDHATEQPEGLLQWAVTASFYAGLHLIEAHLARVGLHSNSHWHREQLLVDRLPDGIYIAYRQLKSFSEQCRYYGANYDATFVQNTVVNKYLERIDRFCNGYSGESK